MPTGESFTWEWNFTMCLWWVLAFWPSSLPTTPYRTMSLLCCQALILPNCEMCVSPVELIVVDWHGRQFGQWVSGHFVLYCCCQRIPGSSHRQQMWRKVDHDRGRPLLHRNSIYFPPPPFKVLYLKKNNNTIAHDLSCIVWCHTGMAQVYMGSLIKIVKWVVYLAAAVIGFGAAILWVAQGSLLTQCSPKGQRGAYTGIFW